MKKKLNIKLIIILSFIIILLIVAGVLYFTTDFFRTKRSAFFRYFNTTTDALNILEKDEYKGYREKKQITPYIRSGEVTIQNSSNIADSGILDKIKFGLVEKTDYRNQKSNIDISIKKDSTLLERISGVRDRDIYGFFCEDVTNTYICVKNDDLKRIASDIGIDNSTVPNEFANINIDKVVEISNIEKKHLLECTNILNNNVPDTAYNKEGKKRIKINDKSYTTTAYSLSLDETENSNIQAELLDKISKDSILMDFFASKSMLIGLDEKYTKINSLNEAIKTKIEQLRKNPNEAGKLAITVFEYKQKNARTEIKSGDNTIVIDHMVDENVETSSIKFNNVLYQLQYNGNNYSITYQDSSNNDKKVKIDFSQDGSIENNDIKNHLTITFSEGIKNITYSYNDKIEFISNGSKIAGFEEKGNVVLNDYSDEDIKNFVQNLKEKINSVYVTKGAMIGINLDPLFET
ncbi:MAG: hypothetical protein IKG14_03180 [Clostridia bacterium]|nr:hypothetical protein [Clostridia bacterium]